MANSTVPGVVQHPLQQSLGTHTFISRDYHKISVKNFDKFWIYAPSLHMLLWVSNLLGQKGYMCLILSYC